MMLETAPAMSARSLRAMLLNLGGTGLLESNSGAADYIGANSPNLLLHWDATDIFREGFEYCPDITLPSCMLGWEVEP